MKKPLILAAALLLGTAAVGTAIAMPRLLDGRFGDAFDHHADAGSTGERIRVADSDHHRRRDEARRHHREHHDDDDDDDRGGERWPDRGGRAAPTGPSDPSAPVPDNGLFQGKTRPKVEVN